MHLSTMFVVLAIAASAVCALPLQDVPRSDPSTSSDLAAHAVMVDDAALLNAVKAMTVDVVDANAVNAMMVDDVTNAMMIVDVDDTAMAGHLVMLPPSSVDSNTHAPTGQLPTLSSQGAQGNTNNEGGPRRPPYPNPETPPLSSHESHTLYGTTLLGTSQAGTSEVGTHGSFPQLSNSNPTNESPGSAQSEFGQGRPPPGASRRSAFSASTSNGLRAGAPPPPSHQQPSSSARDDFDGDSNYTGTHSIPETSRYGADQSHIEGAVVPSLEWSSSQPDEYSAERIENSKRTQWTTDVAGKRLKKAEKGGSSELGTVGDSTRLVVFSDTRRSSALNAIQCFLSYCWPVTPPILRYRSVHNVSLSGRQLKPKKQVYNVSRHVHDTSTKFSKTYISFPSSRMHLSTIFVVSAIATSAVCALPLQSVDPSTSSDVLAAHAASDGSGGQPRVESSLHPRAPCLISCEENSDAKADDPVVRLVKIPNGSGKQSSSVPNGLSAGQTSESAQRVDDSHQSTSLVVAHSGPGQSDRNFGLPPRTQTGPFTNEGAVPHLDIPKTGMTSGRANHAEQAPVNRLMN
ncbi:hypothetical protein EV360DRAFT_70632 [Lentinula raphanica]|nr:hypothetical protein EV360DRAFT_70632 [Lentinula raphanica]